MQTKLRELPVQFDPGHLHVIDRACQQNPRQRMDFQMLRKRWSRTRNALMKKQSILMNETERHKLGKPAGLFLNLAEKQKLIYPMSRSLHMPIHQRRCAADTKMMSCADNFFPLFRGQLVA